MSNLYKIGKYGKEIGETINQIGENRNFRIVSITVVEYRDTTETRLGHRPLWLGRSKVLTSGQNRRKSSL